MSLCLIDSIGYRELPFILTGLYLTTAVYCFSTWFELFRRDTSLSGSQKRFCLQVLTVATLLWPVVLPLTSLEKRLLGAPIEDIFWQ